jgi:ribosomal protein S18 acetylase RimI-like enzyme
MVEIRKMLVEDENFIVDLSSRFYEFEHMDWRNEEKMKSKQLEIINESIQSNDNESDIFVAYDGHVKLGFIHITASSDYFTGENQGYVSLIAVAKEGEGKGIAKKLMCKAEEWSKSRGYKQLTLNVFTNNKRAVDFYTNLNYRSEISKMVKEL